MIEVLTERAVVFADPRYPLAQRAGHSGSSALGVGCGPPIPPTQTDCARELLDQEVTLGVGLHLPRGVPERARLLDVIVDLREAAAGGDVYVLKSVLHDWDDERCIAILQSCRAAMDEAARLAIIEVLLPERMTRSDPMLSAALLDLIMLACAGGRERTEAEFTQLLDGPPSSGEHNSPRSGAARPRSRRRVGAAPTPVAGGSRRDE